MSKAKKPSDKAQPFDTRVAHGTLIDGLKIIKDSLDNASLERKIEIGSVLRQLDDSVRNVLDAIKKDVRTAAVAELKGHAGHITLQGDDLGEVTVTIPEASLRVPKGTDVADLEKVLGKDFALFFEEILTIKPRKEFEERVNALEKVFIPDYEDTMKYVEDSLEEADREAFFILKLIKDRLEARA